MSTAYPTDGGLQFHQNSLTKDNVPDYNSYCTAQARIDWKPVKPETNILYQPYIDESPTDPSTILTAMETAEQIINSAGKKYTIFTADQQLYAIVLNIIHTKAGGHTLANKFHWCMLVFYERRELESMPFKRI